MLLHQFECFDPHLRKIVLEHVADRMEVLLEDMYLDGIDDCIWLGYYYLKDGEAEKNEALDHAYTLYAGVFGDASLNLLDAGGAYLVDPRPAIVPSQILSDGIHPTYSGSDVLANMIWTVMEDEDMYR